MKEKPVTLPFHNYFILLPVTLQYIWVAQNTPVAMSNPLVMLALWAALYKLPRQDYTPRSAPSYSMRCTHVCQLLVSYLKMGSETILSKTKLCSCGTKSQHSRNHLYL